MCLTAKCEVIMNLEFIEGLIFDLGMMRKCFTSRASEKTLFRTIAYYSSIFLVCLKMSMDKIYL